MKAIERQEVHLPNNSDLTLTLFTCIFSTSGYIVSLYIDSFTFDIFPLTCAQSWKKNKKITYNSENIRSRCMQLICQAVLLGMV